MSKYARKLSKMGAKPFVMSMSWISNYILFFPNATVLLKYTKEELLNILEFAVPPHWRKAFVLRDFLPTSDDKARFISKCERVKQNELPLANKHDGSDDDCTSNKKTSLQNLRKVPRKVARKQIRSPVHPALLEIKKIAREKELSEKNNHIRNGLSARKSMLLRAGRVRMAIPNLPKEEKAFLKSIDKKENSGTDSD
jgi:hypothetical protein